MKLEKLKTKIVLCLVSLFLILSCNNEITDFFESIKDNGYRSTKPLGKENIKVDEDFLGGYVYKSLPVIISKKNDYVYEINFLSTSLYKEDRVVEAHITKLGGFTFMNLKMGDYFCFLKFNILFEEELQVDLVKNGLKEHVKETELKSWLSKNANEGVFKYTNQYDEPDQLNAFYSFVFKKITTIRAYDIQKNVLYAAKENLFKECYSYTNYEELVAIYPQDEFKLLAESSLFEKCRTIYDYERFLNYFPNSDYAKMASAAVKEIKDEQARILLVKNEKINYELATKENTIIGFENYLVKRKTDLYVDSALYQIRGLVKKIKVEDIEWKWVGEEQELALQYIFYKIDYLNELEDVNWIIQHMSFYAIKMNSASIKEKTLVYMDKLFERNISQDAKLNLFLEKGFLLWSMGKNEMAINTFGLKISSNFIIETGSFKDKIKLRYDFYNDQEIGFPDQKSTWKKIKKLK